MAFNIFTISKGVLMKKLLIIFVTIFFSSTFIFSQTPIFINEIHYDNASGDVGEGIEIAGPASTDLTGWSLVLYNGSSTQLNDYGTINLSGVIPEQCNGGTLWFPYSGIQNGSPDADGVALVDDTGNVIQF